MGYHNKELDKGDKDNDSTTEKREDSCSCNEIEEDKPFYNTRALQINAVTYELERFERKSLVIFNHTYFTEAGSTRNNTEKDLEAITETFNKIGFKVDTYNNMTKDEIFEILDTFSKINFTDYGCIAIAILTHGSKNILRAKDQNYYVSEIMKYFQVHDKPTLATKARMLIIQLGEVNTRRPSRANELFNDIPAQPEIKDTQGLIHKKKRYHYFPMEADILTVHSSYSGKPALRGNPGGSWFIQTLCKKVDELAATHDLQSIFTAVNKEIAFEKEHVDKYISGVKMQMPVITSTLTRRLYLKKYEDNDTVTTN